MPECASYGTKERVEQRGRILVVDDSRLVRVLITGILERAGFAVTQATDGNEALSRLARDVYDVVITDLNMPGVDGLEVLAGVKRTCPHVEVIILTGSHAKDVSYAVRALRLGAHDYVAKPPSNPDQVVLTVERALEKKRLQDANQRLMRELEILSHRDQLTGALNRRSFEECLAREVARARRHGHDLSVVMMDIDKFKLINDTHGHPGGDRVLASFARIVAEVLREGDTLFRFGGDEFAALLPCTPPKGALAAGTRIVSAVANATIAFNGRTLRIGTSVGAASLATSDPSGEDLVTCADKALYEAKQAGRNRAVIHTRPLALVSRPA